MCFIEEIEINFLPNKTPKNKTNKKQKHKHTNKHKH